MSARVYSLKFALFVRSSTEIRDITDEVRVMAIFSNAVGWEIKLTRAAGLTDFSRISPKAASEL
jgi:hypothetical protein